MKDFRQSSHSFPTLGRLSEHPQFPALTLGTTLGTSTVSCYERLYAGQLQFPDFRQTVRTSPVSRTNFRVIRLTEILQFPAELTLDRMLEHPVVNITSLGASA